MPRRSFPALSAWLADGRARALGLLLLVALVAGLASDAVAALLVRLYGTVAIEVGYELLGVSAIFIWGLLAYAGLLAIQHHRGVTPRRGDGQTFLLALAAGALARVAFEWAGVPLVGGPLGLIMGLLAEGVVAATVLVVARERLRLPAGPVGSP